MIVAQGDKWLESLAKQMKREVEGGAAPNPEKLTVRQFLYQFGFLRRTPLQVAHIRGRLKNYELRTNPDFVGIWVDQEIAVELVDKGEDSQVPEDPTVRIGSLPAARREPTSVAPDQPLSVATSKMLMNDYSQLPVMTGSHTVKGVITWKSIGARYALGQQPERVQDCMDSAREIGIDSPILTALEDISEHGYVLIRGGREHNNAITGIVTASDVAQQFKQLTGPFLLIEEIERNLRNLIFRRFKIPEMAKASSKSGSDKPVKSAADLTFGAYRVLLSQPDHWDRLQLNVERDVFIEHLDSVREIRNDVVHFNPDGINEDAVKKLEDFVGFFRDLNDMNAV